MFSSIAAPLTDSLKGKARKGPITWTKECEEAFDKLKNCLCNHPVLHSPDYQKPFIVETDASDQGMGVVLSQLADNETEEHPIIYLSKKFTSVEKRYSLLESLHQCTGCREDECGEMEYEFPCFNILETLDDGLWSPTPEHVVYGGVRLRCRDEEHLLESMFTRLQVSGQDWNNHCMR
ncbi:hypothetical protein JTE90_029680 [Oedothorax gibbosus]|uniref:Reverse transcriptase/retrotransposon-derived protein RNase H-like domain-containing protein n=1 Tax=Oedothorax gibbosus TaxID=931172 RepID=A0AAV6TZN3_9ARAC|nr:hypothetical protein JTE90_029680 [Oedothorax gibbosus]